MASYHMQRHQEWGTMAAMGQQRPPWSVGLLALASSNTITTHNIDDDMPDGQCMEWYHLMHLANHVAGIEIPLPNIMGYTP
jgi:hypothetical protein